MWIVLHKTEIYVIMSVTGLYYMINTRFGRVNSSEWVYLAQGRFSSVNDSTALNSIRYHSFADADTNYMCMHTTSQAIVHHT